MLSERHAPAVMLLILDQRYDDVGREPLQYSKRLCQHLKLCLTRDTVTGSDESVGGSTVVYNLYMLPAGSSPLLFKH